MICDAVEKVEGRIGARFDVVTTLQATSPLLRVETLEAALGCFAILLISVGRGTIQERSFPNMKRGSIVSNSLRGI